jgi:hypothetical protein
MGSERSGSVVQSVSGVLSTCSGARGSIGGSTVGRERGSGGRERGSEHGLGTLSLKARFGVRTVGGGGRFGNPVPVYSPQSSTSFGEFSF